MARALSLNGLETAQKMIMQFTKMLHAAASAMQRHHDGISHECNSQVMFGVTELYHMMLRVASLLAGLMRPTYTVVRGYPPPAGFRVGPWTDFP
eukprot:6190338-Pleurochrysis_carterae.AAC.2